jgi:hypothetical protein
LDSSRPTEFFGKQHMALVRLDSVRPGDVLLSRDDAPVSTLFAKLSGGRWSHAALWIPVRASERSKDANSWINLQLVEADEFGIGATPLRHLTLSDPIKSVMIEVALLPGYPKAATLLRNRAVATLSATELDRASQYLRDNFFHRDYPTRVRLIAAATSIPTPLRTILQAMLSVACHGSAESARSGPFCSELAARFYEALGISIFKYDTQISAHEVSPNHFDSSYSTFETVADAILASEEITEQLLIRQSEAPPRVSGDVVLSRILRPFFYRKRMVDRERISSVFHFGRNDARALSRRLRRKTLSNQPHPA